MKRIYKVVNGVLQNGLMQESPDNPQGSGTAAPRGRGRFTLDEREREERARMRNEKFKAIAQRRVVRSIVDIRLLGNFASDNYDYTENQVEQVVSTLQKELDTVANKLRAKLKRPRKEVEFVIN